MNWIQLIIGLLMAALGILYMERIPKTNIIFSAIAITVFVVGMSIIASSLIKNIKGEESK